MLHILTGFEKRSSDPLKANQKDVLRRLQDVNFESVVQMHSHCIICITICVPATLTI